MTASEDAALYEAAKTLFYQSSDDEIRMHCLDREEYYQDLKNYERKIEQDLRNYERKIEQDRLEHERIISEKNRTISAQTAEIEKLRAELAKLKN